MLEPAAASPPPIGVAFGSGLVPIRFEAHFAIAEIVVVSAIAVFVPVVVVVAAVVADDDERSENRLQSWD